MSDQGPGELRQYVEAAAAQQGLDLPDEYWGPVTMFFGVLMSQAALVESGPGPLPHDPAPVFGA